MVWKLGDRNIQAGRSWVDGNNITHPTNWMSWTDDEKKAAGLTWTDDPKPYDSTWYLGWNSDESALLPKPLADLQASKVEEANLNLHHYFHIQIGMWFVRQKQILQHLMRLLHIELP